MRKIKDVSNRLFNQFPTDDSSFSIDSLKSYYNIQTIPSFYHHIEFERPKSLVDFIKKKVNELVDVCDNFKLETRMRL